MVALSNIKKLTVWFSIDFLSPLPSADEALWKICCQNTKAGLRRQPIVQSIFKTAGVYWECIHRYYSKDMRACKFIPDYFLDLSKAYRLKPGTGWLIGPSILHAPGSLCTYEPQWGSDVFGMYQSLVEGRYVPWDLLVKDMPKSKHRDLDFIVNQLDWEANVDPNFKDNHYLEPVPVADTRKEGFVDRWIVYGKVKGKQYFTAKELTVEPGVRCKVKDRGAYGLVCVQGSGTINGQPLNSPKMIRFTELTEDEYFCTEDGAKAGVTYENTSETEPLVVLRYFGPDVNPDAPAMGAYRKNKF